MICGCAELIETIVDDSDVSFEELKANHDMIEVWSNIEGKLLSYRKPFDDLQTEYLQIQYLESKGLLVKPENYQIGERKNFEIDRNTNFCKPVRTPVTGQYVLIEQTLSTLNKHITLKKNNYAGT